MSNTEDLKFVCTLSEACGKQLVARTLTAKTTLSSINKDIKTVGDRETENYILSELKKSSNKPILSNISFLQIVK